MFEAIFTADIYTNPQILYNLPFSPIGGANNLCSPICWAGTWSRSLICADCEHNIWREEF